MIALLIALGVGIAVGAIVMVAFSLGALAMTRRQIDRRMGYIDFTTMKTTIQKGGTASAKPYDVDELSEGGQSRRPPSHLRLLKGENNG